MRCNSPSWGMAKSGALLTGWEHSQRASQASALPSTLSSSRASGSRCGRQQGDGSSKRQPMEQAHPASSNGEAPPGSEAPSPSAAARCRARCSQQPAASPADKLRLVPETVERLRDQRGQGVAAAPGSQPCLLQLPAATRQNGLCRSEPCLLCGK